MILGRGSAQTDDALITEYHQFLEARKGAEHPVRLARLHNVPLVMCQDIGKPPLQWSEDDILRVYEAQRRKVWDHFNVFLSFLFFRGYMRPSVSLLSRLRIVLGRQWSEASEPYRRRIRATAEQMGYQHRNDSYELTLLLWLLVTVGKPLEEITREDFETFRESYRQWHQQLEDKRVGGPPRPKLFRLEKYLVAWGIIPKATLLFHHERQLASLQQTTFREAIVTYLKWCEVKYKVATMEMRRIAVLAFFIWLQATYPQIHRLDQVTRSVALAYLQHLKQQHEAGCYGKRYHHSLYESLCRFFDFAVGEPLETAPLRSPFQVQDVPRQPEMIPRYLSDHEVHTILEYCNTKASLIERTLVLVFLHTGIRAAELAALKASDIVEIAGRWKLHIHEGKGLKDRLIPLTPQCLQALRDWQETGWEKRNDFLFTRFGRAWKGGGQAGILINQLGRKLELKNITPHRFRHTFAVALLNYGVRESALQKLMGHATLNMTLEYARILDQTVEKSFSEAIAQMQDGGQSWVPSFFIQEEYTLFAEGDSVSWIQLPVGFCRRNPKLHCESDVKCFLCERFCATPKDLPRLQQMYERFTKLGLKLKADVVSAQIQQLQALPQNGASVLIPTNAISVAPKRAERS